MKLTIEWSPINPPLATDYSRCLTLPIAALHRALSQEGVASKIEKEKREKQMGGGKEKGEGQSVLEI